MTTNLVRDTNVIQILNNPENIIPELSADDIKVIVIQTILNHIDNNLPLKIVFQVITKIKQYCHRVLAPDVSLAIERIDQLESPNSRYDHLEAEDVLVDTLEILVRRGY